VSIDASNVYHDLTHLQTIIGRCLHVKKSNISICIAMNISAIDDSSRQIE
jgi:hypothetical protein